MAYADDWQERAGAEQQKVSDAFMDELVVALAPLGKCFRHGSFSERYIEGYGAKFVSLKEKGWFTGSQDLVGLGVRYTPTHAPSPKGFIVFGELPDKYSQPAVKLSLQVHNEEVFSLIKDVIARWENKLEKAFGISLRIVKKAFPVFG